jgi:tRNA A37 threonylcarbamoyladenosine dehydratase
LIGDDALEKLQKSRVAVFGIGGVGSFAAEAIARAGVGSIDLFDKDTVDVTNINRQLIADTETVGRPKTEVMRERILRINPQADVIINYCFFDKNNESDYDFSVYNYIVDAIDVITSKILLIEKADKANVPIVSSMGTGNKIEPTKLEVDDIYNTSVCPLARIMRRELKKRGVSHLKVVYSKETPIYTPVDTPDGCSKRVNASISFVPSVAGLILASEVVKDIIK